MYTQDQIRQSKTYNDSCSHTCSSWHMAHTADTYKRNSALALCAGSSFSARATPQKRCKSSPPARVLSDIVQQVHVRMQPCSMRGSMHACTGFAMRAPGWRGPHVWSKHSNYSPGSNTAWKSLPKPLNPRDSTHQSRHLSCNVCTAQKQPTQQMWGDCSAVRANRAFSHQK